MKAISTKELTTLCRWDLSPRVKRESAPDTPFVSRCLQTDIVVFLDLRAQRGDSSSSFAQLGRRAKKSAPTHMRSRGLVSLCELALTKVESAV